MTVSVGQILMSEVIGQKNMHFKVGLNLYIFKFGLYKRPVPIYGLLHVVYERAHFPMSCRKFINIYNTVYQKSF